MLRLWKNNCKLPSLYCAQVSQLMVSENIFFAYFERTVFKKANTDKNCKNKNPR